MKRMTPAYAKANVHRRVDDAGDGSYWLAGLCIVALFPALFWTTLLGVTCNALGQPLDTLALATIATAIGAFLAAVGLALRED
jgi:hypothetical protein